MEELRPQQIELIGREEELNLLKGNLEDAIIGKGSTILISGEAGVGKTRLVDEFLDQAEVHNSVFLGVGLVEATLRQTLVERHLATLVAIDRYTGTGLLTFDTAATHFTFAGTRTTANAGPFWGCTWVVAQFIEFHIASPTAGSDPMKRSGSDTAFLGFDSCSTKGHRGRIDGMRCGIKSGLTRCPPDDPRQHAISRGYFFNALVMVTISLAPDPTLTVPPVTETSPRRRPNS